MCDCHHTQHIRLHLLSSPSAPHHFSRWAFISMYSSSSNWYPFGPQSFPFSSFNPIIDLIPFNLTGIFIKRIKFIYFLLLQRMNVKQKWAYVQSDELENYAVAALQKLTECTESQNSLVFSFSPNMVPPPEFPDSIPD